MLYLAYVLIVILFLISALFYFSIRFLMKRTYRLEMQNGQLMHYIEEVDAKTHWTDVGVCVEYDDSPAANDDTSTDRTNK